MIINESGGGAGLNLKVVGSTTQPTSPAENTIWVNTDTEINGYAFSSTEPTNPVEGMVWFSTGTSANAAMNIDKKNTVILYPEECSQYKNGEWVDKSAQTYLNGEWVEWLDFYYLYDNGDQYATITGGWKVAGNAVLETSALLIQGSSTSDRAYTNNYLNVGPYSTLYVDVEDFNAGAANGKLAVLLVKSDGSSLVNMNLSSDGVAAIPIDSVTSACQIWFRPASTAYMSARVTRVRLA